MVAGSLIPRRKTSFELKSNILICNLSLVLYTLTPESHMCIFVLGAFIIGLLLMDLKTLSVNNTGVLRIEYIMSHSVS
jgi:hypothetical protein